MFLPFIIFAFFFYYSSALLGNNSAVFWFPDAAGLDMPRWLAQQGYNYSFHGVWNIPPSRQPGCDPNRFDSWVKDRWRELVWFDSSPVSNHTCCHLQHHEYLKHACRAQVSFDDYLAAVPPAPPPATEPFCARQCRFHEAVNVVQEAVDAGSWHPADTVGCKKGTWYRFGDHLTSNPCLPDPRPVPTSAYLASAASGSAPGVVKLALECAGGLAVFVAASALIFVFRTKRRMATALALLPLITDADAIWTTRTVGTNMINDTGARDPVNVTVDDVDWHWWPFYCCIQIDDQGGQTDLTGENWLTTHVAAVQRQPLPPEHDDSDAGIDPEAQVEQVNWAIDPNTLGPLTPDVTYRGEGQALAAIVPDTIRHRVRRREPLPGSSGAQSCSVEGKKRDPPSGDDDSDSDSGSRTTTPPPRQQKTCRDEAGGHHFDGSDGDDDEGGPPGGGPADTGTGGPAENTRSHTNTGKTPAPPRRGRAPGQHQNQRLFLGPQHDITARPASLLLALLTAKRPTTGTFLFVAAFLTTFFQPTAAHGCRQLACRNAAVWACDDTTSFEVYSSNVHWSRAWREVTGFSYLDCDSRLTASSTLAVAIDGEVSKCVARGLRAIGQFNARGYFVMCVPKHDRDPGVAHHRHRRAVADWTDGVVEKAGEVFNKLHAKATDAGAALKHHAGAHWDTIYHVGTFLLFTGGCLVVGVPPTPAILAGLVAVAFANEDENFPPPRAGENCYIIREGAYLVKRGDPRCLLWLHTQNKDCPNAILSYHHDRKHVICAGQLATISELIADVSDVVSGEGASALTSAARSALNATKTALFRAREKFLKTKNFFENYVNVSANAGSTTFRWVATVAVLLIGMRLQLPPLLVVAVALLAYATVGGTTCVHTIGHSSTASRYYDNNYHVNLTSGEVSISPGTCISWYREVGNNTKVPCELKILNVTQTYTRVPVYRLVKNFELTDLCDYKCGGSSFSGQDLVAEELILAKTHHAGRNIGKRDSYLGVGCGACAFGTWVRHRCFIHWDAGKECVLHKISPALLKIDLTYTEAGQVTKAQVTVGEQKTSVAAHVTLSIPSTRQSASAQHTRFINCGEDWYEYGADWQLPSDIIVYAEGVTPDYEMIGKKIEGGNSCSYVCQNPCTTTWRGALDSAQNAQLRSVSAPVEQQAVFTANIELSVEGVLVQAGPCTLSPDSTANATMDRDGYAQALITFAEQPEACVLTIRGTQSETCTAADIDVTVGVAQTGVRTSVFCKEAGPYQLLVNDQSVTVNVRTEEAWFYQKIAGLKVNVIGPGYSSWSWPDFRSLGTKLTDSLFGGLADKALLVLFAAFVVWVLALNNPILAVLVAAAAYFFISAKAEETDPVATAAVVLVRVVQETSDPYFVAILWAWLEASPAILLLAIHLFVADRLWRQMAQLKAKGAFGTPTWRVTRQLHTTVGNSRFVVPALSAYAFSGGYATEGFALLAVSMLQQGVGFLHFGKHVVLCLHTLFPERYANTPDVIAHLQDLSDLSGGKKGTCFDKCTQTNPNDDEFRWCCAGRSGTLNERWTLVNETVCTTGGTYCGFTINPKWMTKKNVIYDEGTERETARRIAMAGIYGEDELQPGGDEDTLAVRGALAAFTTRKSAPYLGASVDIGFLRSIAAKIGFDGFFKDADINFAAPAIFQMQTNTGCTNTGFCFQHRGAVFTNYHVTEGRPLILPTVSNEGKVDYSLIRCVFKNEKDDLAIYGKSVALETPDIGEVGFVINPAAQQAIVLRVKGPTAGHEATHSRLDRFVFTQDYNGQVQAVEYNKYSLYGWSGLPIISASSGQPIGIYGKIGVEDGRKNVVLSPQTSGLVRTVDWRSQARQLLDGPLEIQNIVTPTASGKSTLFPLELAMEMVDRKNYGTIVVLNPLRATTSGLAAYVRGLVTARGLASKITVESAIGGERSFSSMDAIDREAKQKVVIVYMSYGTYWNMGPFHSTRVVLMDEFHTQTVDVMICHEREVFRQNRRFFCATMTATGAVMTADRPIADHEVGAPTADQAHEWAELTGGLYFHLPTFREGRKHLVFCATKNDCETVAKRLRDKLRTRLVYTFYRDHPAGASSIQAFNSSRKAIIVATNAIESGITLNDLTDVWDTQEENVVEVEDNGNTCFRRRPISKKSAIQRRGRCGRTTDIANYWFPRGNDLPTDQPIDYELKLLCAAHWLAVSSEPPCGPETREVIDRLRGMYDHFGVHQGFWRLLTLACVGPSSFAAAAFRDAPPQPRYSESFLRAVFARAIKEQHTCWKTIRANFIVHPQPPSVLPEGVEIAQISMILNAKDDDEAQEEKNSMTVMLGTLGLAAATATALGELVASVRSFATPVNMWILPSDNWLDLAWGCQYDLILGYSRSDSEIAAGHLDPHILATNPLFKRVLNVDSPIRSSCHYAVHGVNSSALRYLRQVTVGVMGVFVYSTIFDKADVAAAAAARHVEPSSLVSQHEQNAVTVRGAGWFDLFCAWVKCHDTTPPLAGWEEAEYEAQWRINQDREVVQEHYRNAYQRVKTQLAAIGVEKRSEEEGPEAEPHGECVATAGTVMAAATSATAAAASAAVATKTAMAGYATQLSAYLTTQGVTSAAAATLVAWWKGGVVVAGGIPLVWDQLVGRLGDHAAAGAAVLVMAMCANPGYLLNNVLASTLTYGLKHIAVGSTIVNGYRVGSTPYLLAGSVALGTALASMRVASSADAAAALTSTMSPSGVVIGSSHGSTVIVVQRLYHIFRRVVESPADMANISDIAASAITILVEMAGLGPTQMVTIIVATATLAAIRTACKYNERFRTLLGYYIAGKNGEQVAALEENAEIDYYIDLALSIAALVVAPSTSISVGILLGWNAVLELLEGRNVTKHSLKGLVYESVTAGAGLPIYLALGSVIAQVSARYISGRLQTPTIEGEQNCLTAISGLFSCLGAVVKGVQVDVTEAVNARRWRHCVIVRFFQSCAGGIAAFGACIVEAFRWVKERFCALFGVESVPGYDELEENDGSADMFRIETVSEQRDEDFIYSQVLSQSDDEEAIKRLASECANIRQNAMATQHLVGISAWLDLDESMFENTMVFQYAVEDVSGIHFGLLADWLKDTYPDIVVRGASGYSQLGCEYTTLLTDAGPLTLVHTIMDSGLDIYQCLHFNKKVVTVYTLNTLGYTKDRGFNAQVRPRLKQVLQKASEALEAVGCGKSELLPHFVSRNVLLDFPALKKIYDEGRKCLPVPKNNVIKPALSISGGIKIAVSSIFGARYPVPTRYLQYLQDNRGLSAVQIEPIATEADCNRFRQKLLMKSYAIGSASPAFDLADSIAALRGIQKQGVSGMALDLLIDYQCAERRPILEEDVRLGKPHKLEYIRALIHEHKRTGAVGEVHAENNCDNDRENTTSPVEQRPQTVAYRVRHKKTAKVIGGKETTARAIVNECRKRAAAAQCTSVYIVHERLAAMRGNLGNLTYDDSPLPLPVTPGTWEKSEIDTYQQVASSNAIARYVADITNGSGLIIEPCAGLGHLTALCAYQNRTPLWLSDISVHCIEQLRHLYQRPECPVKVVIEQRDVMSLGKQLRGQIVVCNPPYNRPEDATLGSRVCKSIFAQSPARFICVWPARLHEQYIKLIPKDYDTAAKPFVLTIPGVLPRHRQKEAYIPVYVYDSIRRGTGDRTGPRVQFNSALASVEEELRQLDVITSTIAPQTVVDSINSCQHPLGAKFDPARKSIPFFNNRQDKPFMAAPVNTLLLHKNIVEEMAENPASRRAGRCMPADPKIGADWALAADADKTFQLLVGYRIANDGSIECIGKKTHADILCLGLPKGQVDYIAQAANAATIQTDVAAHTIAAGKTNVVDRPENVNHPASLVYVNLDVIQDTSGIQTTPLQTRVYFTEQPWNLSFWQEVARFPGLRIHWSPTAPNGSFRVFVETRGHPRRKSINSRYLWSFAVRHMLDAICQQLEDIHAMSPKTWLSYPKFEDQLKEWSLVKSEEAEHQDFSRQANRAKVRQPVELKGGWPGFEGLKGQFKNRLDRLGETCAHYKIKLQPASRARVFQNQEVLGTYNKNVRLQEDKTMLQQTTYRAANTIWEWDPRCSTVKQVSRDRVEVLGAIQDRIDAPHYFPAPDVLEELHTIAGHIRTKINTKLRPFTFEEARVIINKQSAAGMLDEWSNMEAFLNDPRAKDICEEAIQKLYRGENVVEYYNTVHNKVESKVSDNTRPRLINYGSIVARVCDHMLFGPFVKLHYGGTKLFKHASGGTPIAEMGDRIKKNWDHWSSKCVGDEEPVAAVGDASRWDHSMYPALMALEAEFVSSFYDKEHWPAIQSALEHVCWPLCFTRLGFVFTNPGQRMSGHVFTWMNSFLNAVLHEWGWKKTLNIPLEANLDDYLTFEVDGDDNYHISTTSVINAESMEQLRQNMASVNIKIRSKTFDGYRITDRVDDIDYLSHYYAPTLIRCEPHDPGARPPTTETGVTSTWHKEKYLPVRPIDEILGKWCFTIKHSTTRDSAYTSLKDVCGQEVSLLNKTGLDIESSKALSYLLQYPHIRTVRVMAITILSQTGFASNPAWFKAYRVRQKLGEGCDALDSAYEERAEDARAREAAVITSDDLLEASFHLEAQAATGIVVGALRSIYGQSINSLDDIGCVDFRWERASCRDMITLMVNGAKAGAGNSVTPDLERCALDAKFSHKWCSTNNQIIRAMFHLRSRCEQFGIVAPPFPHFATLWKPYLFHYSRFFKTRGVYAAPLPEAPKNIIDDFAQKAMGMVRQAPGYAVKNVGDILGWLKRTAPDNFARHENGKPPIEDTGYDVGVTIAADAKTGPRTQGKGGGRSGAGGGNRSRSEGRSGWATGGPIASPNDSQNLFDRGVVAVRETIGSWLRPSYHTEQDKSATWEVIKKTAKATMATRRAGARRPRPQNNCNEDSGHPFNHARAISATVFFTIAAIVTFTLGRRAAGVTSAVASRLGWWVAAIAAFYGTTTAAHHYASKGRGPGQSLLPRDWLKRARARRVRGGKPALEYSDNVPLWSGGQPQPQPSGWRLRYRRMMRLHQAKDLVKRALSIAMGIATKILVAGLAFCITLFSIVYPFVVPSFLFILVCTIYCSRNARLALLWYLLVSPSLDAATTAVRSGVGALSTQIGIVPAILRNCTSYQK
ncbi:polyprotein [Bole tick virus 4]|uniref:polyprotein n=1 Tax=Bole tick virus 4 TaxID=1746058 RepID=UPI0007058404|nr:polyprotein [Bole tick virus 4]ALL52884.1 polyprotein [Bole tick virus 4]